MLICVFLDGTYTLTVAATPPQGALRVAMGLFPEMDIEIAKRSTHALIDTTEGEVVHFGTLNDCEAALIKYRDFGPGFKIAPVSFSA